MDQLTFFKSLSDQTRIDILTFLLLRGESCVCDLMSALDLNQPKISRHLALLRSAKILQDRRVVSGGDDGHKLHGHHPAGRPVGRCGSGPGPGRAGLWRRRAHGHPPAGHGPRRRAEAHRHRAPGLPVFQRDPRQHPGRTHARLSRQ